MKVALSLICRSRDSLIREGVVRFLSGRRAVCLFLILFFSIAAFPQTDGKDTRQELERLLENYFSEDETKDMEQLVNELQMMRERPLNINTAGEAELASLHFLGPLQIRELIRYREKSGMILSVYELASVAGFDEQLAALTGQFVVFGQAKSSPRRTYSHHEVLTRAVRLVEKQAGFREPKKYEGSPEKLYLRYRYTSSSLDAGFTGEKDAGESFFRASNKAGFDFYSGFARVTPADRWTLLLGDYVVQFGQGLVAWQGFSLGKSAESTKIGNFSQGVKPHTSGDENLFMRGGAASLRAGRLRLTPFFSFKSVDANIDRRDDGDVFTSFQTSGYHRTSGEISDEKPLRVLTAGGNIRFDGKQASLGLTGVHVRYPYPLVRNGEPYQQFLFTGKRVTNMSVDYRYGVNRFYVFGELATNFRQGLASTTGMVYQLFDQVELASVCRYVGKRYSSPLASAFVEGSQVNDEKGVYLGARVLPLARVSVNMYIDFFRFSHAKYTTVGAAAGKEFLTQINYKINKDWQVYGRYFCECKPVKVSGEYSKKNVDQVRQSLRINLTGDVSPAITLKTRFEQTFFTHDHYSCGFFIGQDVGVHPEGWPVSLWGRVACFKTGDYDSRIYAYENDLLYQFSVPALYGEGIRSYVTGKVKICEKTEFWFKLSQTRFFGVSGIGSGNSLISGNKRTEVKFQIRFRI